MSRVAVVTGGASGIGLATAQHLAAAGNRVAVTDLSQERCDEAAAAIRADGDEAVGVAIDVADRAAVAAGFDRVRAELGPVEILVTSAGIESFDPLAEITDEIWDRVIAVNLTGTFTCIQHAVADMTEGGWGRIVTISSSSALSGAPRMAHYTASKGGVISLTRSMAVEFARAGITVNSVAPTVVDTPMAKQATEKGDFPGVEVIAPMIPMGRAGTPDDIAAACAYLCSEEAGYTTGQILAVSGGMYI
ncbi:MAG: 3-oxoacyl-ACP reductase FabG [Actinobacteria bacterium]|nr:3-oxoacyl-ACP reductase FabG [Actinomycetota bacterium]